MPLDDLYDGQPIDVLLGDNIKRSGIFGGVYKSGSIYWLHMLTDRGWHLIPTSNVLEVSESVAK